MKEYDARFSLPDAKEIGNTHQTGSYFFRKTGNDRYALTIGNDFRCIEFTFSIETAKGVVHWNAGAASMREMYENMEMESQLTEHLFVRIGDLKLDLKENRMPVEIRILNSHVTYDPVEAGDLEFCLEIIFDSGHALYERPMFFTVMHNERECMIQLYGEKYRTVL